MRNVFLVCYDVSDAKRLRQVHRVLKGAGDSLQYSVFRCELTREEKQRLISELWEIINPGQDRLLFANLGPANARGLDCLEYWGEPREQPALTRPLVL
jgi:CRISPR-associated protein Cas2